ncbi:MAG: Fpg/Nei family DNA glycosylase [Nocardioidaceae bacterium]|nr:Fpg/Nei family DNA glycosylase [Nocardioidaceae bacterium]
MPEGDTVWRTAQRLDHALSGRALTKSDFRVPQWAEVDLTGQLVLETVSRGKHLLTRLETVTLHTHLKMEGSWHVYGHHTSWRSPAFQARVVLANDQWQAVGFRLGEVELVERTSEGDVVGHLGPDLLGPDWSPDEALSRLRAIPQRPLGEALLDQRNLAGIGNMYKGEVCFLFGIHPRTPVADVAALPALVERARTLLWVNKDRAQQATTGDLRRGKSLWVYARAGQPCRRCGSKIRSATFDELPVRDATAKGSLSPDQDRARSTYWCPTCQPEPKR